MSENSLPSAPAAGARLRWIDTARGIGIILVVYAHVLRGQVSAKLLAATPIEQLQDAVIYKFHMPLFLMLSGLFAGATIRSRPEFLRRRFVTIVYPYFLWSVLQTLTSMLAHSYANKSGSLADLMQIGLHPIGQFWFLYVLAIFQILLLLPRPLFYLMIPAGILLWLQFGGSDMLSRAGGDLPFFATGVWLTGQGLDKLINSTRRAFFCLAAGAAAFAILLIVPFPLTGTAAALMRYPVAGTAIIATLGLARLLDGKIRLLSILGAASMAIFILHVICAAAARSLAVALHIHQPAIAVVLVTIAGLLIPLAIYKAAIKARLTPWLGLGYPPHAPAQSAGADDARPSFGRSVGKANIEAAQAKRPNSP